MQKASVIVVSDRVVSGEREDRAGDKAEEMLLQAGFTDVQRVVVEEGRDAVKEQIRKALDAQRPLILTCGGTGVQPRNLTPEATEPFITTRMQGIEQMLLVEGLKNTRHAAMSRGLVGFTSRGAGGSLIVNAPGSSGGVKDTLNVILELWPRLSEGIIPRKES